jgi:hypothetical protein
VAAFVGLLLVTFLAAGLRKANRRKQEEALRRQGDSERQLLEEFHRQQEEGTKREEERKRDEAEFNRIRSEIADRRISNGAGFVTDWVGTQREYKSADHVPIDVACLKCIALYGGLEILQKIFQEGFYDFFSSDVETAFGKVRGGLIAGATQTAVANKIRAKQKAAEDRKLDQARRSIAEARRERIQELEKRKADLRAEIFHCEAMLQRTGDSQIAAAYKTRIAVALAELIALETEIGRLGG